MKNLNIVLTTVLALSLTTSIVNADTFRPAKIGNTSATGSTLTDMTNKLEAHAKNRGHILCCDLCRTGNYYYGTANVYK